MKGRTIADRLFEGIPAGMPETACFLRVVEVSETSEVPTAAIDGFDRVRLRLNPEFVERHAATPGRLFMLLMHEIHHVALGHTHRRVVGRRANFAFDAVINALLSRRFPELIRSELTSGPLEDRSRACDQCVVTGYAMGLAETQFLPVEHWLANRLARPWREAPDLVLGPDGKVLVVVEEREAGSDAPSFRLRGLSCSIEQRERGYPVELHREVRLLLEEEMEGLHRGFPQLDPDLPKSLRVNAAGTFSRGGPCGDNGLSGKKLVVDAYGPRAPIGGGALSGKDFYQVDRAGALHARRLAKQLVRTLPAPRDGSAPPREILVLMAWMPGDRAGRLLSVLDPRSGRPVRIFGPGGAASDRTLEASGGRWTGAADLVAVARHGHFTDPALPWERPSRLASRDGPLRRAS